MIELPKTKIPAVTQDPKNLIIFGLPKVGKTNILSTLENNLILDLEQNSDFVSALKIKVKSLKEVVDSLIKKNDDKAFYNYLIKNLKEQGIEENVFVQKVCEMIYRKEDMSKLLTFLQKTFQN